MLITLWSMVTRRWLKMGLGTTQGLRLGLRQIICKIHGGVGVGECSQGLAGS